MVAGSDDLRRELDELLREPAASALERERGTFERATASFGKRIILAGAGNLGRKALAALRADGIEPLAFVDNNPRLWGTQVGGLRVMPPQEAAHAYGDSATFCVTIWRGEGTDTMADRCRPLREAGCRNVIDFGAMFWKYSAALLPHYALDLPHRVLADASAVREAFDLWSDLPSRAEYVAQVRWRLRLDFENLPPPVEEDIYYPCDLMTIREDEVFVDCGAFDGDTVRDFIRHSRGRFKTAYAFEADRRNFDKLQQFVRSLPDDQRRRVVPIEAALSDRDGTVQFDASGSAASAVAKQGVTVKSVALDSALAEAPTWIKMDIEGSEPAALRGAGRTIADHAPILSVCVYHSQNHLWRIPLQIAELHRGYRLYLRPFVPESWDLVCYAIPASRRLQ